MPVELIALENNRVLKMTYVEPWTEAEMIKAIEDMYPYYEKSDYIVHSIADARGIRHIPKGALAARNGPYLTHPNRGYVIAIGGSGFIKVIMDTVIRISRFQKIKYVTTEEEAWEFLHQLMAEEDIAKSKDAKTG